MDMSTPAVWAVTLVGAVALIVGGTQVHTRPRTARALVGAGLMPVVVGSLVLWVRIGAFG